MTKRSKIFIFTVTASFLLIFQSAFASQWSEVLLLAKQTNNDLGSGQKQVDAASWTYRKAYTNFLPKLSASANAGQTNNSSTGATSNNYSYALNVTIPIFTGFSNIANLQSAYNSYQLSMSTLDKTYSDVYLNLRTAFIDLLIAQENVKVTQEILDRRMQNVKLIKLAYQGGIEDKGNLLATTANQADAEHALSSAKRKLELARSNFSQLIDTKIVSVEGSTDVKDLPTPDFDSLTQASPQAAGAKLQLEAAKISQRAVISEFLPNVNLSGSLADSGTSWPPNNSSSSAMLSLSYSFFPGGANIIDKIVADINVDNAQEQFQKTLKQTRYAVESAFYNFKDSIESLSVRKVFLTASEAQDKIATEKYLNGLVTYSDWNIIENQYISDQQSLLLAKGNAMSAEAQYYNSYGGWVK